MERERAGEDRVRVQGRVRGMTTVTGNPEGEGQEGEADDDNGSSQATEERERLR